MAESSPPAPNSSDTSSEEHEDRNILQLRDFCHFSKVLEERFIESKKRAAKIPSGQEEFDNYLSSVQALPEIVFVLDGK